MSILYVEMMSEVHLDRRDDAWVQGELLRLRSEIRKFKRVAENTFAQHYSSGLLTLIFYLSNHLLHGMERYGNLPFMNEKSMIIFV